jgi:hypothetical protein
METICQISFTSALNLRTERWVRVIFTLKTAPLIENSRYLHVPSSDYLKPPVSKKNTVYFITGVTQLSHTP